MNLVSQLMPEIQMVYTTAKIFEVFYFEFAPQQFRVLIVTHLLSLVFCGFGTTNITGNAFTYNKTKIIFRFLFLLCAPTILAMVCKTFAVIVVLWHWFLANLVLQLTQERVDLWVFLCVCWLINSCSKR